MDKNIIWVVLIIIGVIGVSLVISSTAPAGASYHETLYTHYIWSANYNSIIVNDLIETRGGLVVEVCDSANSGNCPSNPVTGQVWVDSTVMNQIPENPSGSVR